MKKLACICFALILGAAANAQTVSIDTLSATGGNLTGEVTVTDSLDAYTLHFTVDGESASGPFSLPTGNYTGPFQFELFESGSYTVRAEVRSQFDNLLAESAPWVVEVAIDPVDDGGSGGGDGGGSDDGGGGVDDGANPGEYRYAVLIPDRNRFTGFVTVVPSQADQAISLEYITTDLRGNEVADSFHYILAGGWERYKLSELGEFDQRPVFFVSPYPIDISVTLFLNTKTVGWFSVPEVGPQTIFSPPLANALTAVVVLADRETIDVTFSAGGQRHTKSLTIGPMGSAVVYLDDLFPGAVMIDSIQTSGGAVLLGMYSNQDLVPAFTMGSK